MNYWRVLPDVYYFDPKKITRMYTEVHELETIVYKKYHGNVDKGVEGLITAAYDIVGVLPESVTVDIGTEPDPFNDNRVRYYHYHQAKAPIFFRAGETSQFTPRLDGSANPVTLHEWKRKDQKIAAPFAFTCLKISDEPCDLVFLSDTYRAFREVLKEVK